MCRQHDMAHVLVRHYSRIVSKMVLTISGQTCNTIRRNSDEVHVFCSLLSFQQAPVDACTSNRSQVIADFVKVIACTPEEERDVQEEANKKKEWKEH